MGDLLTDKLALEGGKPAVPMDLMAHDWERYRKANDEEIEAVASVLRSGHLSIALPVGMPQADGLEKEFARWTGAEYCVAVDSGTAALHCAVSGVGVEAGDEVIMPAHTFIASAMAVLHQNAIPVFVDTDPQTFLIDTNKIEQKITARTKAIMVVQLFGLPADMDGIRQIAQRHNLKVIEDGCQAYGSLYHGKKVGTLGDAGGFSMCTTKQLMVGEGGLVTTNSKDVYERAATLRLFGEQGSDMKAEDRKYMSETIGWNYKMAETLSALARVRLRHLDEYISGCQRNTEYLTQQLQPIDGVEPPFVPEGRTHTYYIYSVHVNPGQLNLNIEAGHLRDAVLNALAAENVDVARWQKAPVPAQPLFQSRNAHGNGSPWSWLGSEVTYDLHDYPNTFESLDDSFMVRRMCPPNDAELMDRYADAFRKVFSRIDRVVKQYDQTHRYEPLEQRIASLRGAVIGPDKAAENTTRTG